jgi:hypothetical protein
MGLKFQYTESNGNPRVAVSAQATGFSSRSEGLIDRSGGGRPDSWTVAWLVWPQPSKPVEVSDGHVHSPPAV